MITTKTIKPAIKPYRMTLLPLKMRWGKILFNTFAVDENGHTEHHNLPVNNTRIGISGHQICHKINIPVFNDSKSFLRIRAPMIKQNARKKKTWSKKGYILNFFISITPSLSIDQAAVMQHEVPGRLGKQVPVMGYKNNRYVFFNQLLEQV